MHQLGPTNITYVISSTPQPGAPRVVAFPDDDKPPFELGYLIKRIVMFFKPDHVPSDRLG